MKTHNLRNPKIIMFQAKQIDNEHRVFGYSGLIPFVTLPIAIALIGTPYSTWLMSYAALIFTFLGGVLWMASLQEGSPKHISWVSIIVMLWAWCWLLFPYAFTFHITGLSFFLLWLYEKSFLTKIYSSSFWQLRTHLSAIAGSALIVSGFL